MTRRRRFSDRDMQEIAELREAGWTYARIGQRFGISGNSISYYCLKMGVEPPVVAKCWSSVKGPASMVRGNHVVRRFTPVEDSLLLKLEAEGASYSEIGRTLGRAPNSIAGRLMTLARRDAREEPAA
ncbi:hypothetical protein LG047_12700 [Methylocystis sp. WRRC1]|uniref:hypothetical protein n=1 Tax=unclassified Methylocystis TaxID=2625913 RepID=UPI0001F8684D|nr:MULTISPECIES: hypothetical protein [unclassified Methylocystis]MCC3246169.1 hypothetical protein [Methylocystis sp. WRRC1]